MTVNSLSQGKTLLDGTDLSTGRLVAFKKISKLEKQQEVEIATFFSNTTLASDPSNHCVPILRVLEPPDDDDCVILVMPFLRHFFDPPFRTVGETVDFFKQIFEVGTYSDIILAPVLILIATGSAVHASSSRSPSVSPPTGCKQSLLSGI